MTTIDLASRLAAAIAAAAPDPKLRLRQGVIQAVDPDGTVTVTIGGGSEPVPGVRVAANVCPCPQTTVWLATDGRDMFVLAALAPWGAVSGSIRQDTPQSIPAATWTALDWTSATDDREDGVLHVTNGLSIIVPGWYQITATVAVAANATGDRHARLTVNGGVELAGTSAPGWAGMSTLLHADGLLLLAPGDIVNVETYQGSGGTLATSIGAGRCVLRALWVSPAAVSL